MKRLKELESENTRLKKVFAGLSLEGSIPDHMTIMNFRHLLEKHKLGRKLFKEVNKW
jgi:transposase, IS5 family